MIRVRFAPSPTGYLHVGGVRTALFNWYYSKKNNGKFILRIEDTDVERSKKEYEDIILDDFKWCGIDYDEGPDKNGEYGPYRQSERFDTYKKYIDKLIVEKKAYYAIYSKEDNTKIIKKSYEYPKKYYDEDYSITINFKVEKNKKISFNDLIKGEMIFDSNTYNDFVIFRSNGVPMYNFTVVIDDYLMNITHVFRGEDHLSNTPKQIMLYEALGFKKPEFAHIPLIIGEDKAPLSKRHGGTSVAYFKEEGYLPSALMNYLAVLGWSTEEQVFNFKDKIEEFDITKVSNKSVVFDYKKLLWINSEHLRNNPLNEIFSYYVNWCSMNNISLNASDTYIKEVIDISRQKVSTLKQLHEFSKNFYNEEFEYEEKYLKYTKKEWFKLVINEAIKTFEGVEYSIEKVEEAMQSLAKLKITGKKNTFQSVRGALLGTLVTPGLYESIVVLGKERVIKRLKRILEKI